MAIRALRSLGMGVFLAEYEFLALQPPRSTMVDYFIKKRISDPAGAGWRAGAAKKLFSDKALVRESLEYIANGSSKATAAQRERAKHLLSRL